MHVLGTSSAAIALCGLVFFLCSPYLLHKNNSYMVGCSERMRYCERMFASKLLTRWLQNSLNIITLSKLKMDWSDKTVLCNWDEIKKQHKNSSYIFLYHIYSFIYWCQTASSSGILNGGKTSKADLCQCIVFLQVLFFLDGSSPTRAVLADYHRNIGVTMSFMK